MKINCNDGCLDNYPGNCVKYTGPQISYPSIVQNSTLNDIVNIFATSISTIPGGQNDVYVNTETDVSALTNTYLNTTFPNAFLGFSVHYTNITGNPTAVYRFSKYDMINGLWIYFQGGKVP